MTMANDCYTIGFLGEFFDFASKVLSRIQPSLMIILSTPHEVMNGRILSRSSL